MLEFWFVKILYSFKEMYLFFNDLCWLDIFVFVLLPFELKPSELTRRPVSVSQEPPEDEANIIEKILSVRKLKKEVKKTNIFPPYYKCV